MISSNLLTLVNFLNFQIASNLPVQCGFRLSESTDLSNFDAIYVPGGVPSSSAIRSDPVFVKSLKNFMSDAQNKDKLVAIICSGNEILIDLELLQTLPVVVGSPASHSPLEVGLQAVFQPASNYKGILSSFAKSWQSMNKTSLTHL